MILVNLAIDSSGGLFVAVSGNIFLHNCWSDGFMNSGVMMTCLVPTEPKPLVSGQQTPKLKAQKLIAKQSYDKRQDG